MSSEDYDYRPSGRYLRPKLCPAIVWEHVTPNVVRVAMSDWPEGRFEEITLTQFHGIVDTTRILNIQLIERKLS